MARGWESKAVEEQQNEKSGGASGPQHRNRTPEELQRDRKKAELLLSRSRVSQQIEAAANPRYAEMLRSALTELDRQLAELND